MLESKLDFLKGNRQFAFFLPPLLITGCVNLKLEFSTPYSLIFAGAILATIVVAGLIERRRLMMRPKIKYDTAKTFNPFMGVKDADRETYDEKLIDHRSRSKAFDRFVEESQFAINFISGVSGSGKSLLVADRVSRKTEERVLYRNKAESYFSAILNSLTPHSARSAEWRESIQSILGDDVPAQGLRQAVREHLELFVKPHAGVGAILYLDQCEPLWRQWDGLPRLERERLNALIDSVGAGGTRLFFIVEKGTMAFVLPHIHEKEYDLYYVQPIAIEGNSLARKTINDKMSELGVTPNEIAAFFHWVGSRKPKTSFEIMLGVFLFSAISDKKERSYLVDAEAGIIDTYVAISARDYFVESGSASASTAIFEFEAVLLTLSLSYLGAQEFWTTTLLSEITHIPVDRVERVVSYLIERKIIIEESLLLRHDLLVESILKYSFDRLPLEYREALTALMRGGAANSNYVRGLDVMSPYTYILDAREIDRSGATASFYWTGVIWIASLTYWARITFPTEFLEAGRALGIEFPVRGSVGAQTIYFQAAAFVLYVWECFLMKVDRGVFNRIEHKSWPTLVLLRASMVFGPIIGLYYSYHDIWYLMALIPCGVAFGLHYFGIALELDKRNTLFSKKIVAYSWQTSAVNMVISLTVFFIMDMALGPTGNLLRPWSVFLFCLVALLFAIFAHLMEQGQGAQEAHWNLLALYDAARFENR